MVDEDLLNTDLYDYDEFSNDATAASFGFNFQENAGIFLFLEYIAQAEQVKIESRMQDIDIALKDGKHVYAQAKSAIDFSKPSHSNKMNKFIDAMISLSKTFGKDHDGKFIYVSNLFDTFDGEHGLFENNLVFYNNCPEILKNDIKTKIDGIIPKIEEKYRNNVNEDKKRILLSVMSALKEFPKEKLGFLSIYFFGDDVSQRYKQIKKKVYSFLINEIGLSDYDAEFIDERLLEHWRNVFEHNSTVQNIPISIESFIWPVVVFQLDHSSSINVDECCSFIPDQRLKNKTHNRIYKDEELVRNENFLFSNTVISDFLDWKNSNDFSNEPEKRFIKECGDKYIDRFSTPNLSKKEAEYFTKCMLARILGNYNNINRVNRWMVKKHGY